MTGRTVTIDEAMEKIGSFSAQDAIDLIESSQNVAAWIGKGGRGHPLQHCEMTTRSWPGGSRFQNLEALLDPQADGPGMSVSPFGTELGCSAALAGRRTDIRDAQAP
jgi:hypothetical protein